MTLRFLSSFLIGMPALGLFAVAGSGCESGLQGRLDVKRVERFAAATSAVADVESKRYAALAGSVPTAPAAEGVKEHALDGWHRQVTTREDHKTLATLASTAAPAEGMTVGARGTPAAYAAELGAQFLKESTDFWSNTQSSSMSRYADFLRTYVKTIETARAKAEAEAEKKEFVAPPFIDEANFDIAFIHALNYLNVSRLGERGALFPSNASDYQVAFRVAMRTASEGFSDYISRLCALNDDLRPRCAGVPHEFRPAVVDHAFLEWMLGHINAFNAVTEGGVVFKTVLEPIGKSLAEAVATPVVAVEDPILPPTVAPVGGINGVQVVLSPNSGLKVHDTVVAATFTGSIQSDLKSAVGKVFDVIKATPGGGVDYQRAALELPTDLAASEWVSLIRAFPKEIVKELFFVARRRVDDSMRRTAVNMKLPRPDDGDTASYQFKEDGNKSSCALVGTLGDAPFGKKKDFYLELTPKGLRLAELLDAEEAKDRVLGPTTKFGALGSAVEEGGPDFEKFLTDNPGIRLRVFLRGFAYGDGLDAAAKVLYACKDQRLSYDEPGREPLIRACGNSEQRSIAMVLNVCE